MYCQRCGQEIFDEAVVCVKCGCSTRNAFPIGGQVSNEDAPTLLKVLSFFIPMAGIILYFVDRDKKPVSAKQCLKMAMISICSYFAFVFLMFIFIFTLAALSS